MLKYPRTLHIESSRHQLGDDDDSVRYSEVAGELLTVEEKVDGSNCGISFDGDTLLLQSRGHYLSGNDHPQFALFKSWANYLVETLYIILGTRYIMYGEWVYAKHTIFYDNLPHYFLEFDIFDKETKRFLDTPTRHKMLAGSGIVSVPVIARKQFPKLEEVVACVGPSQFKTKDMNKNLLQAAVESKSDIEQTIKDTDPTLNMEGLYIKVENEGEVRARYKWIRSDFCQQMISSGSHWAQRNILKNVLTNGVNIFNGA